VTRCGGLGRAAAGAFFGPAGWRVDLREFAGRRVDGHDVADDVVRPSKSH